MYLYVEVYLSGMSPRFNPQIRKHENLLKIFQYNSGAKGEQELSYTQLMHLYIHLLIYSFYYSLLLYAKHCARHRIYIVNKEMVANFMKLMVWNEVKEEKRLTKIQLKL